MLRKTLLFTTLCCMTSAIAAEVCPLTLTGPSAVTLLCSPDLGHLHTSVLTFTVTNHTPNAIEFTPTLGGGNPSPSSIAITGGTCVHDFVPAESSCTIQVTVTAALCSEITMPPQIISESLSLIAEINQTPPIQPFLVTVTTTLFDNANNPASGTLLYVNGDQIVQWDVPDTDEDFTLVVPK
jgi:hypothetical protein